MSDLFLSGSGSRRMQESYEAPCDLRSRSYVTRDHLDFFHFIGRVIGKAIHDALNLEARKPNRSRERRKGQPS